MATPRLVGRSVCTSLQCLLLPVTLPGFVNAQESVIRPV